MITAIAAAIVILLGGIFYFNYNSQVIENSETKEFVKSDKSKVFNKAIQIFIKKRRFELFSQHYKRFY